MGMTENDVEEDDLANGIEINAEASEVHEVKGTPLCLCKLSVNSSEEQKNKDEIDNVERINRCNICFEGAAAFSELVLCHFISLNPSYNK